MCHVKLIYIIVVPTEKYVINLSGFMQFLVYLSVMINWVNHRVNDLMIRLI